jgi:hypothetical protein
VIWHNIHTRRCIKNWWKPLCATYFKLAQCFFNHCANLQHFPHIINYNCATPYAQLILRVWGSVRLAPRDAESAVWDQEAMAWRRSDWLSQWSSRNRLLQTPDLSVPELCSLASDITPHICAPSVRKENNWEAGVTASCSEDYCWVLLSAGTGWQWKSRVERVG